MENGNSVVNLEGDAGVDDQNLAKSLNEMPCHLGSYILGRSKRIMKNVIRETDGFYSNNLYYRDTDNAYFHKKSDWLGWLRRVTYIPKMIMAMQVSSTLDA